MALNQELSSLFERMASVMEIKGENPFKSVAFRKVARVLGETTQDLRQAVEKGTLGEIQGIGPSSQKVIAQYVRDGKSDDYEQLITSIPAGLLPMLQISGLGPKTIALFWKERNVTSIDELSVAIESGKLEGLKGVGEKKIASIKQGIELLARSAGRLGLVEVAPIAQAILAQVRKIKGVIEAEAAGSLRRLKETIGDVDLLCAAQSEDDGAYITGEFVKLPEVARILGQGGTKASILTHGGLQVDLRVVPHSHYGAALLYFTGSKEHNVKLRARALDMGLTLNEWGLYTIEKDASGDERRSEKARSGGRVEKETGLAPRARPVAAKTEEDIYKALKLQWMTPELREDRGEIEAADAGKLPGLITLADIQGDLHMHTTASDGTETIEAMAHAAKELGYQYIAITDHSKSSVIANGLSVERLLAHVEAIRKVDAKLHGIRLLAGCEVDILVDGRLDYDDEILKELDIVIASPHVSLKQDEQKATDRMLRVIDNPYVNVIGHPTGRYINSREGLPFNAARVFEAAAKAKVVMEINASWPRLDLNDIHARAAVGAGCRLSIDTDTHSIRGLGAMPWGVGVARRAWVKASDVINTLAFAELKRLLNSKR